MQNPGLTNYDSHFQAWSRLEYSQRFLPCLNFFIHGLFPFIVSRSSLRFLTMLVLAHAVFSQNKIHHPAHGRKRFKHIPYRVPTEPFFFFIGTKAFVIVH